MRLERDDGQRRTLRASQAAGFPDQRLVAPVNAIEIADRSDCATHVLGGAMPMPNNAHRL